MADKWSDEEIKTLKSMYSDKKRISEIAIALGRTEGAVRKRAHSLNIRKTKEKPRGEVCDYAIYKGDEFIFLGTLEECCDFMEMEKKQIRNLCRPSHIKRADSTVNGKALVGVRLPRENEGRAYD